MSINEEVCGKKSRGDRNNLIATGRWKARSICSGGTVMKPPRWPIWWK